MKRIAIFCIYEETGAVDRSTYVLLGGLVKVIDKLVVVVNGELQPSDQERIKREYGADIIIRENLGFDFGAYKDAMLSIGWEKLSSFDEMVHMNDTCFGPIYPFTEMFEEMRKRSLDFWGVTCHEKLSEKNSIYHDVKHRHINSYFYAYGKNMISSSLFQSYWEKIKPPRSYNEAIYGIEVNLTREYERMGFNWGVYINTEDIAWLSECPVYHQQRTLLERKCPLIKKRAFYSNYGMYIEYDLGRTNLEAFNFIQRSTSFDVDIIWDFLLRRHPPGSFGRNLHLNYVLPAGHHSGPGINKKIAVVLHITYEDIIDETLNYVRHIPRNVDLFITTKPEYMREVVRSKIQNLGFKSFEVRVAEDRGRLESALLIGCRDVFLSGEYDLVCYIHDKKSPGVRPGTVSQAFMYKYLENTLASESYLKNIVQTFEENPRLGLLAPPPPLHSYFQPVMKNPLTLSFEPMIALVERLGLNVQISPRENFITLGSAFWCRPAALRKLFQYNWKYSDFPEEPAKTDGTILHAIERIYGFVAQDAGYYCGWVMNDQYARIELTNLYYFMFENLSKVYPDRLDVKSIVVALLRRLRLLNLALRIKRFFRPKPL